MKHLKTPFTLLLVIFIASLSITSCSHKAYGCYDFTFQESSPETSISVEPEKEPHCISP